MSVVIDSYPESNYSARSYIINVHPSVVADAPSAWGQSFTGIAGYSLTQAKFYLQKIGNPVGNLVAQLYALTGTYGTDAKPTGPVLAESDPVALAGISTSYGLVAFNFSIPYALANQNYAIVCVAKNATTLDWYNYVNIGRDETAQAHSGNAIWYSGTTGWNATDYWDVIFYVLGVTSGPPPSSNAKVCIAFDDGNQSQYDNAWPLLKARGIVATLYVVTDNIRDVSGNSSFMTVAELRTLQNAGNEIASHSKTHAWLVGVADSLIIQECSVSKQVLQNYGFTINNFAVPYGGTDDHADSIIGQYYRSNRTAYTGPYIMVLGTAPFRLPACPGENGAVDNAAYLRALVDQLVAANGWMIIFFHNIVPDSTPIADYQIRLGDFTNFLDYLTSKGVGTLTVNDALGVVPPPPPPPPVQNGFIEVYAYQDTTEIAASVTLDGQSGTTPVTFTVPVGTYTLTATYGTETLPTQSVTIIEGQTITVNLHFAPAVGPATVTITVTGQGTTNPAAGVHTEYNVGDTLNITATATIGWQYQKMRRNGVDWTTANPGEFLNLAATENIEVIFIQPTITLNVTAEANGTVSPSGVQTLIIGETYQYNAISSIGYYLDHWDLGGANIGSTNPLPLTATSTMDGKTLTAIFTAVPPVQISMNVAVSGNGTTNPAPGPHTFNVGDIVTFTATSGVNNAFREWTLDGIIYTATPVSIQITNSMAGLTLTAVFNQTAIMLTVASGANGSVTPSGSMILVVGQQYLFAATPSPGYQVDIWNLSGVSLGSTSMLTLTATVDMDQKSLTALFTAVPPPQITMNVAAAGSGTTNPAAGAHTFNVGDTVQFTAIPAAGQTFKQWTLDGTVYSANPLSLPITADMQGKTLTAEFTGPSAPPGLDLPTIGGILVGVSSLVLGVVGVAHLAGIV